VSSRRSGKKIDHLLIKTSGFSFDHFIEKKPEKGTGF